MEAELQFAAKFDVLKVCVIIPTYNNAATIAGVINDVATYTHNIIIVNDGSTDSTAAILSDYEKKYCVISYPVNKGKGWALRQAFSKAWELGYQYGITIDSDGQHFAADLPLFIEALGKEGAALIMGARNLDQENVPGKSSFGNKFSNFWFRVETGISLPDTQTGYRLYPLQPIQAMHLYSTKYELEIEVIVRLAWKGVKVVSIPITVYYPPQEERISHFRPFKDFSRISVLNTVLFTIAVLYIHPRNFLRFIFKKRNWRTTIKNLFNNPNESNIKKSMAMGFGAFMGIIPIWGFQLIVAIAVAHFLKLNKALVILASHVSVAPLMPFVLWGSYEMGKPWMGTRAVSLNFNQKITLDSIKVNLEQYLYGSISLAVVAGIIMGSVTLLVLAIMNKNKPKQQLQEQEPIC